MQRFRLSANSNQTVVRPRLASNSNLTVIDGD